MKFIYLIIASLLIQCSDCDNKKIVDTILFGLDISKSNKQLITQLKSDSRFTNYTQETKDLLGMGLEETYTDFDFTTHPLIKKNGSIQFQSASDGGFYYVVLYFTFAKEEDANNAFNVFCSELDKGCFEKETWNAGSIDYNSDKIRVFLHNIHSAPGNSVSLHISRK